MPARILETTLRAVELLLLTLAPSRLPPEPAPPPADAPALLGLASGVALAGALLGGLRLLRASSREGRAAGGLVFLAVLGTLAAAAVFRGERAPLGRAVPVVALPVWAAVAALAATAAGRLLGTSFRSRRSIAALAVLAFGGYQLLHAWKGTLSSFESMWAETLVRGGAVEAALERLSRALVEGGRPGEARAVAGRCLARRPGSCACHDLRAEARLAERRHEEAATAARASLASCPARARSRALLALALAAEGRATEAEREARLGLEVGGDEEAPRLRFALASAMHAQGRGDLAFPLAREAARAGVGRDASVLAAALAIERDELDLAERLLREVLRDRPRDAVALYDLALVSDRRGRYNEAREGYLAALRAEPRHAEARYNLALLTHRAGARDEARHHLQKFRDAFPDDPRGATLAAALAPPPPPTR